MSHVNHLLTSLVCACAAPLAGAGGVANSSGDLFATGGSVDDQFGRSVAIGAHTVVVGAPFVDSAGVDSGTVYVYGMPLRELLFELTPDPAGMNRVFGSSVAAYGNLAIAGAPNGRTAYIFDLTTGQQLHRLDPAGAATQTGAAVAINESYALVGSPFDNDAGEAAGAVYVYDVTSGVLLRKLVPASTGSGDTLGHDNERFGSSVALHGSRAVVGAPLDRYNDGGAVLGNAGSVYEFDLSSGDMVRKLEPADRDDGVFFGTSVGVNGEVVVVGSPRDGEHAITGGAVYVFESTTGAQRHKLFPQTAVDHVRDLGRAVALNGSQVIAGAPRTSFQGVSDLGSALVFDVNSGVELDIITAVGQQGDEFGASVAISPSVLAASAPGNDVTATNAGTVRLYSFAPGDLNGDGCVGSIDLAVLLAGWGSAGVADIDGDGVVDAGDLAIILAAWNCG